MTEHEPLVLSPEWSQLCNQLDPGPGPAQVKHVSRRQKQSNKTVLGLLFLFSSILPSAFLISLPWPPVQPKNFGNHESTHHFGHFRHIIFALFFWGGLKLAFFTLFSWPTFNNQRGNQFFLPVYFCRRIATGHCISLQSAVVLSWSPKIEAVFNCVKWFCSKLCRLSSSITQLLTGHFGGFYQVELQTML